MGDVHTELFYKEVKARLQNLQDTATQIAQLLEKLVSAQTPAGKASK